MRYFAFAFSVFAVSVLLALFGGAVAAAPFEMEGLERLEKQLRMSPEQKAQFDVAVGASKRAMLSSAITGMEFKARLQRELLKPQPDLAAIFQAQEALVEQNRPAFREARDEWVKLYALLDEEQVKVARSYVERTMLGVEVLADAFKRYLGHFR